MTITSGNQMLRRRMRVLCIFIITVFVAVWHQHGIGPSADTRELRRQLSNTTLVRFHDGRQKEAFVLQGRSAQEFVNSLFLISPTSIHQWGIPVSIIWGEMYFSCEFYSGTKSLGHMSFLGPQGTVQWSGLEGFRRLYPYSSRRVHRLFHERHVAGDN